MTQQPLDLGTSTRASVIDSRLNRKLRTGAVASFRHAASFEERVRGATHTFYRYPARFAPEFARAAILSFTDPGDVVLDPFMGGGTTAVEALVLRRRFIGADVNPLSCFLTRVKTTALSVNDASTILYWAQSSYAKDVRQSDYQGARAFGSTAHNVPWWLRSQIATLLESAEILPSQRLVDFARCSILRTSQWALDNRKSLVSCKEFRAAHWEHLQHMLGAAVRLRESVQPSEATSFTGLRRLLCRSASGLELDSRLPSDWKPVRLVVTSPPYPGVHVLYHRWQVRGRRETSAPFWIVGREDGHSASFFTMGPRYAEDLSKYLVELESSFRSIAALLDRRSLVVQMMGFSDPEVQLGPFLEALEAAGLEEVPCPTRVVGPYRTWRTVPNRKWHASMSKRGAGRELLLVHRLAA